MFDRSSVPAGTNKQTMLPSLYFSWHVPVLKLADVDFSRHHFQIDIGQPHFFGKNQAPGLSSAVGERQESGHLLTLLLCL